MSKQPGFWFYYPAHMLVPGARALGTQAAKAAEGFIFISERIDTSFPAPLQEAASHKARSDLVVIPERASLRGTWDPPGKPAACNHLRDGP